jgi:hypothetical protein
MPKKKLKEAAKVGQNLLSAVTDLADCGITSADDFSNLKDDLSEIREIMDMFDELVRCYRRFQEEFRSLDHMWISGISGTLFEADDILGLLGFEALPDSDDPEFNEILKKYCAEHEIDISTADLVRQGTLSTHSVCVLIRCSGHPEWFRQRIEKWFRAFAAEVQVGHL